MADRPLYAVILAGGAARRMSGQDKPMLPIAGKPLLEHVLDAVTAASDVVVVGPRRDGIRDVRWTCEQPPGGGPVAALTAGLAAFADAESADVAVLAADLPGLRPSTIGRLRAAMRGAGGAVLVDETGHRQWLTGVWGGRALARVLPAEPAGRSIRRTLGPLRVIEVPAHPGEAVDVDTPEDVARLRAQ